MCYSSFVVSPADSTQLLKGVLDLAVLAVLSTEDGYGYDVVRRLRDAGLKEVAEASVYGTLRRLFADGYLSSYVVPSEEGPHRKYYALTPSGRTQLVSQALVWRDFSRSISSIVDVANTDMTRKD